MIDLIIESGVTVEQEAFIDSLHARETLGNGRIRERELFKISPEKAYGIFREIATLRNESENLRLYAPTEEQSFEQEIAEAQTRRSNNSFTLLNIPIGTEIGFLYQSNITAKVVSSVNEVEYQGQKYSVTALAKKILIENYGWNTTAHVNGWKYFTINGITLIDLRNKIEAETEECSCYELSFRLCFQKSAPIPIMVITIRLRVI